MRTNTSIPFSALMISLLTISSLALMGCRVQQVSNTVTYGSIGWDSADERPAVIGLDQAMLSWYFRNKQLIYVVWTDLDGGGGSVSGSNGGMASGVIQHQTSLGSSDGKNFEFEFTRVVDNQESGDTGNVNIGGVDYSLSNGALLLVSTWQGSVDVKQLDVNPALVELLQNNSLSRESLIESLQRLATEQPEISAFFERVAEGS